MRVSTSNLSCFFRKTFDDLYQMSTDELLKNLGFYTKLSGRVIKLHPWVNLEERISKYIHDSLSKIVDLERIELPFVWPLSLWKTSGRIEKFGDEFFYTGRNEVVLPTSEEAFLHVVSSNIKNYRSVTAHYIIKSKFFRDVTPKNIIRLREFSLIEVYGIYPSEEEKNKYLRIFDSYFESLLKTVAGKEPVKINKSDSYVLYGIAPSSRKFIDENNILSIACSIEVDKKIVERITNCEKFEVVSYAIGLERLVFAIADGRREVRGDKFYISWPENLYPFYIDVIPVKRENIRYAEKIYEMAKTLFDDRDVLLDDSSHSLGVKIRRAYALGIPLLLIVGDKEEKDSKVKLEFTNHSFSKMLNFLELKEHLEKVIKDGVWSVS